MNRQFTGEEGERGFQNLGCGYPLVFTFIVSFNSLKLV